MNFEDAKENIQPLATGRNASILQALLRVESPHELQEQRSQLEKDIHNYVGDDPLEPWYAYISWIEQSYPSGGKESGLEEVMTKCLSRFDGLENYYQDRRMIKLYIKFIDSHKNPTECYQQLFNAGIGTMVADFYISWAYCYDLCGNTRKAEEIFRKGLACRAEPFDELQEAHQHFYSSVAQRLLYEDDDTAKEDAKRELNERRMALTSLRGHRKAAVGSIRTGAAVKSYRPGTVQTEGASTSRQCNARVQVFGDENVDSNQLRPLQEGVGTDTGDSTLEPNVSVVRSIIDATRNAENQKEPGPWNKAHDKKKSGKLFGKSAKSNELCFSIHEDGIIDLCASFDNPLNPPITEGERNCDKPFKYPTNFQSRNRRLPQWNTPVTIENEPELRTYPQYNKCMLYPRPNKEYQCEELLGYRWCKKRNINNAFTRKYDHVWGSRDITAGVRQYPNFAKQSLPQKRDILDEFYEPPKFPGVVVAFEQIYNKTQKAEFQIEELFSRKHKERHNETIIQSTDMDETVCLPVDRLPRRRSFFPVRKSLAPIAMGITENNEDVQMVEPETAVAISKESVSKQTEEIAVQEPPEAAGAASADLQSTSENAAGGSPNISSHNFKVPSITIAKTAPVFETYQDTTPFAAPFTVHFPMRKDKEESGTNSDGKQENSAAAVATAASTAASTSKAFKFDIYTEKSPPTSANVASAFDAEETCSTQIFNLFLNPQSLSTPKAPSVPGRQFGTLLKEIRPPQFETADPVEESAAPQEASPILCPNNLESDNTDATAARNSIGAPYTPPMRKQLSTILETSEQGNSQATHTTGASTKSTISSPDEFETDLHAVGTTVRPTIIHTELETVQEQSESSSSMAEMREIMQTLKSHSIPKTPLTEEGFCYPTTNSSTTVTDTPGVGRLQGQGGNGFHFGIFEDPAQTHSLRAAGDYTRIEQREDTNQGIAMQPMCFQDDKTDTISKMFLQSRQFGKFPDDKTETISKMSLRQTVKQGEDTTNTIPHMNFQPPNLSKLFIATPSKAEKAVKQFPGSYSLLKSNGDLSFNFSYCEQAPTPRKPCYDGAAKAVMEKSPTPKSIDDGDKNRGAMLRPAMPIFEDEVEQAQPKKNLVDSFVPFKDYSIIPTSSAANLSNKKEEKEVMPDAKKILLRDSFLPDFSMITQTQQHPIKSTQNLPNVSSDLSIIPSSQPHSSVARQKQHQLHASVKHVESSFSDFSMVMNSQPLETERKWKPNTGARPKDTTKEPHPSVLTASFLKQFSDINESPKESAHQLSSTQQSSDSSTLKFLNDFIIAKGKVSTEDAANAVHTMNSSTRQQAMEAAASASNFAAALPQHPPPEQYFELNAETEMFATNISMIKNSTWLPNHEQLHEKSLHIKCEMPSSPPDCNSSAAAISHKLQKQPQAVVSTAKLSIATAKSPKLRQVPKIRVVPAELSKLRSPPAEPPKLRSSPSQLPKLRSPPSQLPNLRAAPSQLPKLRAAPAELPILNASVETIKSKLQTIAIDEPSTSYNIEKNRITSPQLSSVAQYEKIPTIEVKNVSDDDNSMLSIYCTPKTPKLNKHTQKWDKSPRCKTPENNSYVHQKVDLDLTQQIIEDMCIDPNVNPFQVSLLQAFLEQISFCDYIDRLPTCMLQSHVSRVQASSLLKINDKEFKVLKVLGEGAYGVVFCVVDTKTGRKYALKQERPPNCWEYYIGLEVQSRLQVEEMLPAYMNVEYALIGHNSSILISDISPYGSLISVCNKIKKHTMRNVDEYVVMLMTCEILEIIDHLHSIEIIHADVKPDNFLLMKKLTYPNREIALQLIDFGVSIDMRLFKKGQTFCYSHASKDFKCVEMYENRQWTYQLDLYGVASVVHVLLFGKYMEIAKRANGTWMHKTSMPRYINRALWETIFKSLLNVRNCNSMPNLQQLRALLKQELAEKEKYVFNKLAEFNRLLDV